MWLSPWAGYSGISGQAPLFRRNVDQMVQADRRFEPGLPAFGAQQAFSVCSRKVSDAPRADVLVDRL